MEITNDVIPDIPAERKIRKHGYADRSRCRTCQYAGVTATLTTCDYSLHTKSLRGCAVEDCDKYKPMGRRVRREIVIRQLFAQPKDKVQPWHQPKSDLAGFNRAAAWTMYESGMSDDMIAKELGCGATPVRMWRAKFNLPPVTAKRNREGKGK